MRCGNYKENWPELGMPEDWQGCALEKDHDGDCTGKSLKELAAEEMLVRLKQAVRYLEHPSVRAIGFAVPSETLAEQCKEAIKRAEGL